MDLSWLSESLGELRQTHDVWLTWFPEPEARLTLRPTPAAEIDRYKFEDYVPEQVESFADSMPLAEDAELLANFLEVARYRCSYIEASKVQPELPRQPAHDTVARLLSSLK